MIRHIKRPELQVSRFHDENFTRTVQDLIAQVERDGDAAVRRLSTKFDGRFAEAIGLK